MPSPAAAALFSAISDNRAEGVRLTPQAMSLYRTGQLQRALRELSEVTQWALEEQVDEMSRDVREARRQREEEVDRLAREAAREDELDEEDFGDGSDHGEFEDNEGDTFE